MIIAGIGHEIHLKSGFGLQDSGFYLYAVFHRRNTVSKKFHGIILAKSVVLGNVNETPPILDAW